MKLARRTLLRRTLQGRRRVWIAGPGRWVVGALLPIAPGLVIATTPAAQVIPGFLFLVAVVAATVIGGRGPGLLATVVATGALVAAVELSTKPLPQDQTNEWVWAGVFLALTVLAVAWVDNLLGDAARRATAVLDPLVEAAPVGIALFDRDLRFVRVNAALARLSRLSPSAHLGRTLADVIPDVPPELTEQLRSVLTVGTVLRHQLLSVTTPAGTSRQLMVDAFPVRLSGGPSGSITGIGAVVADITERNRLEQLERETSQLQVTAQLSHRLLESQRIAQLAGFEVSVAGQRTIWSEELCALMGRTEPPVTDEDFRAHVHPDEFERLTSVYLRALSTGGPFTVETRMIRTDGSVREILVHGEAVRAGNDPDAEVIGLWGVVQDVTEAKVTKDELFATQGELSAAQGELSATQGELVAAQRDIAEARAEAKAERRVLELFQRAMLPKELPDVPGGALRAEYLAVADRIDVGGDWYDAFALPDGRIALSIGDVVGHDQQAAAIMGQVRAINRGYALEQPDPGAVLTRLNRLLILGYPSGTLVSAVTGLYDPGTGVLQWANAGHPYPLLASPPVPGACPQVSVLESSDPILGAASTRVYTTRTLTLPEDGTLLWYTDGLIERRYADLEVGQDKLATLLAQIVASPTPVSADAVIEGVTSGMVAAGALEDDVCVLALQRRADSS
ncbi:SpoIIE family protein phosphatase [Cryptosporangium aurantiacum]|uniref:PAS domain S-box-containing protein n=1 Tax=Cryptosporangium aurantiacum TaxID=134849 RepID=A0A1M7R8N4_9ACTN|nr:SpoIIE family protein phosphatase [Cryptosporangium aurantiacum]SHN42695.1 PAS domain S-box-containing protein [Cryptosporangium aurantiacum]